MSVNWQFYLSLHKQKLKDWERKNTESEKLIVQNDWGWTIELKGHEVSVRVNMDLQMLQISMVKIKGTSENCANFIEKLRLFYWNVRKFPQFCFTSINVGRDDQFQSNCPTNGKEFTHPFSSFLFWLLSSHSLPLCLLEEVALEE